MRNCQNFKIHCQNTSCLNTDTITDTRIYDIYDKNDTFTFKTLKHGTINREFNPISKGYL